MKAGVPSLLAAVVLLVAAPAPTAASWPNDPAWRSEWGAVSTRVPEVWARGTGSPDVVVAVVDTGVEDVPDLAGSLVPGIDLVGGAPVDDPKGLGHHGTWVASIIAARGNNGRDIAGYCWRCSIMPVRVGNGVLPVDGATAAAGIRFAVDHGADVVNVSLAGADPDAGVRAAVAYAVAHGVLVVAAAGNSGASSPEYPGAYPGVLAVAATDEHDVLYPWSTRGSWVALAAPGCTAVVDPVLRSAYGCGSSFAPAAVAGIAALLLSFDPSLTAARVAAVLESSAHAVDGIGGGRVDAAAAFAALALPHVTDASSPASIAATPATAAAPVEVTSWSGTLAAPRTFAFAAGAGRVVVRLAVRPPARCLLQLGLGDGVAATSGSGTTHTLSGVGRAGTRRVTVGCSPRGVRYALEVERPAPRD